METNEPLVVRATAKLREHREGKTNTVRSDIRFRILHMKCKHLQHRH